jgi:hypothetical protein
MGFPSPYRGERSGSPGRLYSSAVGALSRRLHRGTLVAALVACAAPALAQYGRPISERDKAGYWRLGPFRLTPLLQLRNAGVDSNPFLTPGAETSETELGLRAGLQAYLPVGRRLRLRGDGWLDYTFYSEALQQGATYPGGDARAELDISRLTFFGGGGHFTDRQRYTTDIDTRVERTEDWWNGGVQLRLTTLIGVDFAAEGRRFRYDPQNDDPGGERIKITLDRDTLSYQGRFRYKVTPLTTALVSAEVIEDTFVYGDPATATTTSYRYLAGFEFGEKAVLTGQFLGGVRDIPATSAGTVKPYTGPAFKVLVRLPFLQRFRLDTFYDRDVYYSASVAEVGGELTRNTYVYDRLSFTLELNLPLQFVGRALAGWQKADYLQPVLTADGELDRVDRIRLFGFSLLRRLGRSALFGVTAQHTERTSDVPGGDYSRWQIGLQGEFVP